MIFFYPQTKKKTMPLNRIIAEIPELLVSHVLADCGFRTIYHLLLVCTRTRDAVLSARQLWLQCARSSTGYLDASVDLNANDFFSQIRAMLFPWEFVPRVLHFKIPRPTRQTIARRLALVDDEHRLAFVTELEDHPSSIVGFPSRPCDPNEFVVKSPVPRPVWRDEVVLPGAQPIIRGHVIPTFVHGGFMYHRIHAGAFAIVAYFPRYSEEQECCGIYFFVEQGGQAVFHVHHSGPEFNGFVHFSSLCARPQELWIATNDKLVYFGRHSHASCRVCNSVISDNDMVFWDAYFDRVSAHTAAVRSPILQRSLVHYAVHGCRTEALKQVLWAGADPNLCDSRGSSPLEVATRMCWGTGIRMLIRAGAVDVAGMLHHVATGDEGALDTVRTLLDLGADPNAENNNGHSPLHQPHFLSNADLRALLCAKGANPQLHDSGGLTPLHWAVFYRIKDAVVSLVREFGCDVNIASTRYGVTPLMSAAAQNWYEGVVLLVQELHADVNLRDVDGLSALDMAQTVGIVACLQKAAERV